jgi:glycosyltransferase involved in cell wall biosynthesis
VYLTNWSYAARPIVEHLRPKYLLFDCVDDVLAFPYEVQQERVNAAMAWLARRATVVTAVSSPLAEKIARDWHIDAVVLPNGVDAERFRCPTSTLAWCTRNHRCEVQSTVLTQLVALRKSAPGKIWAGFAGTLNHWIDYDAMRALVDAFPDIHLVLIGKVGHLGSASVEQSFRALQRHPSVSFLGPVSYDALPACLHALDILLLTRVPGPASLASSPLKFYEYLAVGKPVVVCGVPVPEDARALVYSFPEGKRGLLDAVRLAVGECRGVSASLRIQRQAYPASHSWETRVEAARACLTAAAGC